MNIQEMEVNCNQSEAKTSFERPLSPVLNRSKLIRSTLCRKKSSNASAYSSASNGNINQRLEGIKEHQRKRKRLGIALYGSSVFKKPAPVNNDSDSKRAKSELQETSIGENLNESIINELLHNEFVSNEEPSKPKCVEVEMNSKFSKVRNIFGDENLNDIAYNKSLIRSFVNKPVNGETRENFGNTSDIVATQQSFSSFKSASGKEISISNNSIDRLKSIFGNEDLEDLLVTDRSQQNTFSDPCLDDAVVKELMDTDFAPDTRVLRCSGESKNASDENGDRVFSQFKTASGSTISVSKQMLDYHQDVFSQETFDDMSENLPCYNKQGNA